MEDGAVALETWPPCVGVDDAKQSTIDDNGGTMRPSGRAFSRHRPLQWPGFWLQRASDGVMELIWLAIGWQRIRRHRRRVTSRTHEDPTLMQRPEAELASRTASEPRSIVPSMECRPRVRRRTGRAER